MNQTGSLTLYLGYATAIATFSAAAVALGLLQCHNRRQRVTSIVVLLLTMLGVASALIAVAKQHTTGLLNVMVFLGFGASAGYVLFSALSSVFMESSAAASSGHRHVAHRLEPIRRGPVLTLVGFVLALLALFVAATPSLFDSFFESQPLQTPQSASTPAPTYESECDGPLPGQGAPEPQAGMLASLWLGGRTDSGVSLIGCARAARRVGQSQVWWELGIGTDGELTSIGVASPGYPPALVLGPAVSFVLARARTGTLVGATNATRVENGDLYLVDTVQGTVVLMRDNDTGQDEYTAVPPPLVVLWLEFVRRYGWTWVEDESQIDPGRHFRLVSDDGAVRGTAVCRPDLSCTLEGMGELLEGRGVKRVGLGTVLSVAP